MKPFQRHDIQFTIEDITLRGWLYTPESKGPHPTIIITPGWDSVKEFYLDCYAESFAQEGFAVLVYDQRRFGESEGLPRQEIDPLIQVADLRHAISFVETLPEVDSNRIGLWGISYSGAHSMVVAATDNRVKAVVAAVPMISGYQTIRRRYRPLDWQALQNRFAEDARHRFAGQAPTMVPTVIATNELASHPDKTAHDFFTGAAAPADQKWRFKNWKNEITLKSIEMYSQYEPTTYIKRVSPTPLLIIVADNDTISQTDLQLQAYEDALHPKQLMLMKGDHFCPYVEQFGAASRTSTEWFKTHLA